MSEMKTVTTEVFKFNELSVSAKESALQEQYDINICHEWWDCTYEDAANVGITITGFDIDRGSFCEGDIYDFEETASKITTEHGKQCETYKTALQYIIDRAKLVEKHSDGIKTDIVAEDNEYEFDLDCDELETEFKQSILEDYRIMLRKNYDYMTSEEAIIETIQANDYDFEIDGSLY